MIWVVVAVILVAIRPEMIGGVISGAGVGGGGLGGVEVLVVPWGPP